MGEYWTLEILHIGYLFPFHHPPPAAQELVEFVSYGLESFKAQALQEEVDKMLGKGAQLIVKNLEGGVWSSICRTRYVMSFSLPSRWRLSLWLGGRSGKKTKRSCKDAHLHIFIHPGFLTISLHSFVRQSVPVQGALIWSFHSLSGLYQSGFFFSAFLFFLV